MIKNKWLKLVDAYKNVKFPDYVKIYEVGPRDGLQNEKNILTKDLKVKLINDLSDTGIKYIESGAFVSPKWIPQMASSTEVFKEINRKAGITYSALVPNTIGLEKALEFSLDEIAIFTSASETFTKKNINCTIEDSLNKFKEIFKKIDSSKLKVRGYVSCVMGCPYEGEIDPKKVLYVSKKLLDMGCYEISLGDTTGMGNLDKVDKLLSVVLNEIDNKKLAVHFHDTNNNAIENILKSLQQGITTVDSSVAGLGGCPYSKTPKGNVCTENLIYVLHKLGIKTDINLEKLSKIGKDISKTLDRDNHSII